MPPIRSLLKEQSNIVGWIWRFLERACFSPIISNWSSTPSFTKKCVADARQFVVTGAQLCEPALLSLGQRFCIYLRTARILLHQGCLGRGRTLFVLLDCFAALNYLLLLFYAFRDSSNKATTVLVMAATVVILLFGLDRHRLSCTRCFWCSGSGGALTGRTRLVIFFRCYWFACCSSSSSM